MPDFSTFLNTPEVRSIVQENYLERAFHDALFPNLIFRAEAVPKPWPAEVGDTYIASAPGLIAADGRALAPGVDPQPLSYGYEQWEAQLQRYAGTIDTHMPTAVMAVVDLLMRNAHQLGLQAAQTLNRKVRNRLFNAAESGNTVADGTGSSSTSLRVKRLQGFTRARNPNSAAGSRVRHNPVSATNPLTVTVNGSANTVTGFVPDNTGDEVGPGVLTLGSAASWSDRDSVLAYDRSEVTWVGGGDSVDDIANSDQPRLQDIRTVVSKLRRNNVPSHPDGKLHAHLGPLSESAMLADTEIQRMLTGRPEHYMYSDMVIGMMLGCIFVPNNECPTRYTVNTTNSDGVSFALSDDFAPELFSTGATTGTELHRILFTAFGGIEEYFRDPSIYITEAGMIGKMGEAQVVNNGVEVLSERIKLIFRAPLNRTQDQVATTWLFEGDWPQRTDAATGTPARYKRQAVLVHAAP